MFKKLFALASVTALTGLVASVAASGCSTTTETTSGGDATTDTKKPVGEGGIGDDEDDEGVDPNCPVAGEFSADDIEKELESPFKGPLKSAAAKCIQADFTAFDANIKDPAKKTYEDLKSGLTANCVSCIFTQTDAANWGPIVLIASDTTKGFANFGACFAYNDTEACGRAFQYDQFCANGACGKCSDSSEQGCITAVWGAGGSCKATHDAVATSCPKLTDSTKKCGQTLVQHAKIVCGGTVTDGGDGG